MKTSIATIAKVAGGLALIAASSTAMASVITTKHNLSASGTSGNHTTNTTEICIFCHTPHGGNQAVNAPIWNRILSSTSVYTRFSSMGRLTFEAAEAPVGSVSLACLSCHDGTQAMNAVINSSGSNSVWDVSGTEGGLGNTKEGFDETNRLADGSLPASDNGSWTGDIFWLGTDLRNDHPISMQYGGGGMDATATNGSTVDPDFAQYGAGAGALSSGSTNVATGVVNYSAAGAAGSRWWVDTGGSGYQNTDFPLYTRADGVAYSRADGTAVLGFATAQPYVECGTCHDPHSDNPTFLRISGGNAYSNVCLTCHAR